MNNSYVNSSPRGEIYFMVDVEADGPIPGRFSMNSFGIVASCVREPDGSLTVLDVNDPELSFYAELKPISDDFLPDAIAVGGFTHEGLRLTGEEPEEAMSAVAEWVNVVSSRFNALPVFAAYPLGFDWSFFYWYLVAFSRVGSPFGFSRHLDVKTLYATKAGTTISRSVKRRMPKHLFSKLPHTHNALDDAKEQSLFLQNIFLWDGK